MMYRDIFIFKKKSVPTNHEDKEKRNLKKKCK